MRKIKLILYFLLMILLYSCDSFDEKKFVTQLKLVDKDFDIVVYSDDSGGVYASSYYDYYKKYRNGNLKKIYAKKCGDGHGTELTRINFDTIGIIRWFRRDGVVKYLDTTKVSIQE